MSASSAARTVRPVKSTSSTSTTTLPGDVDGHLGGPERLHRAEADVVAVEGDVERADGHVDVLELGDGVGQAAGDGEAPGVEADEHDVVGAVVALHDLVGDPGVRARRRSSASSTAHVAGRPCPP